MPKSVMIIAGEASGDLHGAKLVRALRARHDSLYFCGIGGHLLREAGVRIITDASKLAVVGFTEVFSKVPTLLKAMRKARQLLRILKPDLLILIDFPEFNLRVAGTAKALGIPVLYYISPQIWAWRSGRVRKIKKLVDHMAVILPFEKDFYEQHQIPVTFVGHPLLDGHLSSVEKIVAKTPQDPPVIGLLPGSREREVMRHLPVMLDAAQILRKRMENVKFIVSRAPTVDRSLVEAIIRKQKGAADFELAEDGVYKVFETCGLVVAASGTVTLESAISGTPMVIIYKLSPTTYRIGRALIRVKNVALANLIVGKTIVPELIQDQASPENIAATAYQILGDASGLKRLSKELLGIRDLLGGQGASERVADIALGMLGRTGQGAKGRWQQRRSGAAASIETL